jgi:hypothetical protein
MGRKKGQAAAFWCEKLELQGGSGFSAKEFCQLEGLSLQSFYQWRRKLAEQDEGGAGALRSVGREPTLPGFVPVLVAAQGNQPIEIAFPCGATVRVQHGADLALLQRVAACLAEVA